eukprot:scaffold110777_cov22-Tisochrysis_lutea.AAC.1
MSVCIGLGTGWTDTRGCVHWRLHRRRGFHRGGDRVGQRWCGGKLKIWRAALLICPHGGCCPRIRQLAEEPRCLVSGRGISRL